MRTSLAFQMLYPNFNPFRPFFRLPHVPANLEDDYQANQALQQNREPERKPSCHMARFTALLTRPTRATPRFVSPTKENSV